MAVTEEEQAQLAGLAKAWDDFKGAMDEAKTMLNKTKKSMRVDIENDERAFTEKAEALREASLDVTGLPYRAEPTAEAEARIEKWVGKWSALNDVLQRLKPGLAVYGMEAPDTKPLDAIEADIESLRQVWGVAKEWNDKWEGWKGGRFRDINTDRLEATAALYNKRILKLGRTLKGGRWKC